MSRINLKELIEKLEVELKESEDMEWRFITISKKTIGDIIQELKQLENIYNQ